MDAGLIFLAVVAVDLYIVATGRLLARNTACAVQGLLLALVPLVPGPGALLAEGRLLEVAGASAATLLMKAFLVPLFLRRALRRTGMLREVDPQVSLHLSLLLCAGLVILSFVLWPALVPEVPGASPLGVPAGIATLLIGLYLTVTARTQVTQVLGYLVAENGVFVIGLVVLGEFPLVVEMGVLLDVLVAVMLMAALFTADTPAAEDGAGPVVLAPAPAPAPASGVSRGEVRP